MKITEQEYLLEKYKGLLSENPEKRVAIYGIGINTKYILENHQAENLVGLMDAEKEGQQVYGYPVLSMQEAEKKADLIIIVARRAAVRIIYNRIKDLEQKGIEICNLLDMNLRSEEEIPREVAENPYWNRSLKELLSLIDSCEAISFDIFDTLIMRRVFKPEDIFEIVEERMAGCGSIADFGKIRDQAEHLAYEEKTSPNLDDIYHKLRQLTGASAEEAAAYREAEIKAELDHICPRKAVVKALEYALERGKQVSLISDMYLNSREIRLLLERCGIPGDIEILVSCEYDETKEKGGLYAIYKEHIGQKKALHIGDNRLSDIQRAKEAGVTTYQVKSSYEMLMISACAGLLTEVKNLEERKLLGDFMAGTLNDPFSMGESKGRLKIDSLYDLGYHMAAPVLMCFMSMLAEYGNENPQTKILLCARDGYLIKSLYDEIRKFESYRRLPEGIYFLTSRRAITLASIINWGDIQQILDRTTLNDSFGNILENKFGVKPASEDADKDSKPAGEQGRNQLEAYIRGYETDILKQAEAERIGYLSYFKGLGIEEDDCAVFDFITTGTTVYYMDKLFGKGKKLICFATANAPNKFTEHLEEVVCLFDNEYSNISKWNFIKSHMLCECILTSPKGQLIAFDEKGQPCYSGENPDYEAMHEIHRGIQEHMTEVLRRQGNLPHYKDALKMADRIWGLLGSRFSQVSQDIKSSFNSENIYDGVKSQKIWENVM